MPVRKKLRPCRQGCLRYLARRGTSRGNWHHPSNVLEYPLLMLTWIQPFIGQAAGVATSLLWTATSLFFTAAARRIGPTLVNTSRIFLAIALHGTTFRIVSGHWLPDATSQQVVYLAFSGVIGLSIGDQALFMAFMDLGPRRAMLIMATSPIFAAFFGWVALGEVLSGIAWLAVLLTVGGVAWVILQREDDVGGAASKMKTRGVVLAFVGAACQAGGLLLSKMGIGHGLVAEADYIAPQEATYLRMCFAGLGVIPLFLLHRRRIRKRRERGLTPDRIGTPAAGYLFMACGTIVGPYLGVWMSLVASDHAQVGVAQTLCSLSPIFILPFAVWIHKERIGIRAVLGAAVAIGGSALLFLPHS